MNNLLRSAFKVASYRSLLNPTKKVFYNNAVQQRQIARNLWYMCNPRNESENKLSKLCTCGCMNSYHQVHSKAELELVEFLTREVLAERKATESERLPTELDGFKVKSDGAEVIFTKKSFDEQIDIIFNVNHTVDVDTEPGMNPTVDREEFGKLISKPSFKIEIERNQITLKVACSFVTPSEQEDIHSEVFGIDEISVDDGNTDDVYAVSGEVLDSYLYDLILNYLEEKGISNDFVEKLSKYSTTYEHSAYIGLLEDLANFIEPTTFE